MNNVTNIIKAACKATSVATAAGVNATTWANDRVFVTYDMGQFMGEINIGRLPLVAITSLEADMEATHGGGMDGGLVEPRFVIRIMTSAFANRREAQYQQLNRIKGAILTEIHTDVDDTEFRGATTANVVISPICTYLDITVTGEFAFDQTHCGE